MPVHALTAWVEDLSNRTPGNVRGALWLVSGGVMFATMGGAIKVLGQDIHAFEIGFFRCVFGLIVLLPFLARNGVAILKTAHPRLHALRATAGTLTMLAMFYAITLIPLATMTALLFANVLFLIPLAVLFLGEVVRWRRWTATMVGFLGVMVILQPGAAAFDPNALWALAAAVGLSVVLVSVKKLTATDRPLTLMLWFGIASVFVSLGPALTVWTTPTLDQLALLGIVGALGSLGQYFMARAYRVGEATLITPFSYFQLLFATAIGAAFFGENPALNTFIGAAIIVGSNVYIVWRDKKSPKVECV